jgi:hypothetical protein
MAQFKIELLIPQLVSGSYLTETICDFNSNNTSLMNFSSNEKFSIHKNAQRELSFDMSEYIMHMDS